jgi:hypothetical protein
MSLARTSPRGRAWAVALSVVAALVVGTVTAAPARADVGPFFLYVDSPGSVGRLAFADRAGEGETGITTGMQVRSYDASANGSVVALVGFSGGATTPSSDSTGGLLVSVNGATRLLSTYVDTNPVVSVDGSTVWFVSDGDLYRFATSGTTVTRITDGGEFFPPTTEHFLTRISVSPDGDRIAAVYRRFDANDDVDASTVTVSTIPAPLDAPATLFTINYMGADAVEAANEAPAWFDNDTVAFARCATGACATWVWRQVDLTADPVADAAFNGPNNLYDLRKLGTLWLAWKDTGSGASLSTQLMSSVDGALTFQTTGLPRTDSDSSKLYVPVTAAPATISGTAAAANSAQSDGVLLLSTARVPTGGSAVYLAFAEYLRPVGAQLWPDDSDATFRGQLQYSTDGRRTWRVLRTTTGATQVAFPGLPFPGNGRTQALTRNTYFRFVFAGDAFAAPATSTTKLVVVSPTITAKAKKKGTKRVVSGTVKRSGGTIVLSKGTRKLATATIGSTGAFRFTKRTLPKGTYTLKVRSDASWGSSTKKLKV